MSEQVNHPNHYLGLECLEAMEYAFGTKATLIFCRLNTFKYRCRQGKKGSAGEDLAKANWYAAKAQQLHEKILLSKAIQPV